MTRAVRLFLCAALVHGSVAAVADDASFAKADAAYRSGDYAVAHGLWLPLAETGSAEAQFNLGLLYDLGRGVDRDPRAAADWFRQAAEQDFARAQYRLAELYEEGSGGLERDPARAYAWFKLAGRSRFEDARKRRRKVADSLTDIEIAHADLFVRTFLRELKERRR